MNHEEFMRLTSDIDQRRRKSDEPPEWVSFTDRLAEALEEAADAKSEADRLEALLKVVFSELVNEVGESVAKSEHFARGCSAYREKVEEMCTARTKANMSAAKVKGMEHKLDAWRTYESSRREEMRLK
jgi:hypothetical protein